MVRNLEDMLPVMKPEWDAIPSKRGDITIGMEVILPEIFTLSGDDYETFHQSWIKAIRVLPKNSMFHKQDWFVASKYEPDFQIEADPENSRKSFLSRSSDKYFNERPYLMHHCYIWLTKKPAGRKLSSSMGSNLLRKSIVPEELLKPLALEELKDAAGQFQRILEDSRFVRIRRLSDEDLLSARKKIGLIEKYCFLSETDQPMIQDVSFKDGIKIGDKYVQLFSLSCPEDLPSLTGSRINYDIYSTDKTKFSVGFAANLGQLLNCNHIYNQYIFLDDPQTTIKTLESKRLRLQSLSTQSRENSIARDATNDFLNEAIGDNRLPVKVHFNVMAWTSDREKQKDVKNMVSAALAQIDAVAKQEVTGAPQIFWAGLPGNEADFPMNDTLDTFAEQACCFLNLESGYRSDPGKATIRFGDRLTGKQVEVDLFDGPMKTGITNNRGMFVCGGSGGGKSMLCNHIFRSLYDQGAHIVIVDIGGSYKGLCDLLGGYYFVYTEQKPICFNPFHLGAGESLDTEKKESLKALLATLWKQEHETFNRSEYVALSNAIQGYYDLLDRDPSVRPSFNTFYEYLERDYVHVLHSQKVKDSYFDMENFLYVLRPYYKEGEFDYLLNAEGNLDLLTQRFVVFELDNIKDHPILLPVVSLITTEMTMSKMRKIPAILKAFAIEEAWKPMMQAGMSQFMKYAWKTFRKLYGVPIVVTQEIDDLISSPIIKEAIIGNSDIKILMDMRKFMNKFDALQATLGMSDKGKTQLFSVNKANEPGRIYRECYLELGGQVMKVLRNELSPEEYWAYSTEATEKARVQEYAARYGSIEEGIKHLVADLKKK